MRSTLLNPTPSQAAGLRGTTSDLEPVAQHVTWSTVNLQLKFTITVLHLLFAKAVHKLSHSQTCILRRAATKKIMFGGCPTADDEKAHAAAANGPVVGNPSGSVTLMSTLRDANTSIFRTCSTYLNSQRFQPGIDGCTLIPPTLLSGKRHAWQNLLSQASWFIERKVLHED